MSFLDNWLESVKLSAQPWKLGDKDIQKQIKEGKGVAGIGTPLHGLSAGYGMTKLGSAYRLKQGIDRINDGQNPFSSEFIKGTAHDQGHNVQDAFKENWPVLLAGWGPNFGSGGGAAGGGAGSGAGLGAAGAAPEIGAGLEGVTVVGSSGGLGGAGAAGAGLGAVGSFMPGSSSAPMEGVTVTAPGGGVAMSPGTEAAMGAAAASAGGAQANNDPSMWDKIKEQLQNQGMGGQQQQQQPQQQAPPPRQGLGRPGFMDKIQAGLFPVDSRAAEAIGPEALKQQRNQALMRMGLGMMSASSQGGGLGESALFGLNSAQQSLDGALQRGYENARESRQEQRQVERQQIADDRYDKEFSYKQQQDQAEQERADRAFERSMSLDDRALQWRNQDISREDSQFDRRMRVAESKQGEGAQQPPSGYRWSAQGNLEAIPGGPADPQNKTGNYQEAERNAAFLATRVANGLKTLKGISQKEQTPGFMERGALTLGSETAANFWRSEDRQRSDAAQKDMLDAALTLATGAAYTPAQFQAAYIAHFPQIGDSDKTKLEKQQRLETLLQAAKLKAGRAASQIDEALGGAGGGGWQIDEVP